MRLAGFLATMLLGGRQAVSGELAVGSYGVLVFLTQRLLWPLTAPWPWTPRPVVRGPRRTRQEARRRAVATRM